MNTQLKLRVCLLILTLVLPNVTPLVRAQADRTRATAGDKQKEKEAEQQKELDKKTLALLNDLAASSWSLKLPENRLFIMAGAADLLWSFDEKRARTLYWDAINSLNLIASQVRSTEQNPSYAEPIKVVQSYLSTFELRQKLLRQVARKDAQLALEMLRATRQVPPRQVAPEFSFPDDAQLEQGIASEIAARDPGQALQLARQSLAKGVTFEVFNFWQRLSQADAEKGSQYAGDVIAKLRTMNLAKDAQAFIVGIQFLHATRTPDSKPHATLGSASGASSRGPGRVSLEDEQKRDLVEGLTNAALAAAAPVEILVQLRTVMTEMRQYFPERVAVIERKLSSVNRGPITGERKPYDNNVVVGNATVEDLVRLAGASDSATPFNVYYQAAMRAVAEGKTDWFRAAITKQIVNPDERARVIDWLDSEEISAVSYRKQLDQLEKLVPKIRRKEERARAMTELALLLKDKGEDEQATAMLDDAATLIKTDLKDEQQTNALLTLLCAYAVVDPPKAFALAERTIDRANSQISLLLLLDRVVKSGAVRKNEILLEQPGLMPFDLLLFKYGKGVAALARADFNRTRALTERFERNELRLMAQLLVLKGLLEPDTSSATAFSLRPI